MMKSFRTLFVSLWMGLFAIAFLYLNPAIALDDYPDLYPKAELIGSNPKAQIDIYGSPGTQQPPTGKAEVGDRVRVIEQATDNNGDRWDRVQFIKPPELEGWIAEESVSLQATPPETASPSPYFQINQFSQERGLPQRGENFHSQNSPQQKIWGNAVNQYSPGEKILGNWTNQFNSDN